MKKLSATYNFIVSGSDVVQTEPIDMGFIWRWSFTAQVNKTDGTIAGEVNTFVANSPDGPWIDYTTGSYGDAEFHIFDGSGPMDFGWAKVEISGSTGEVEVDVDVFGKGF